MSFYPHVPPKMCILSSSILLRPWHGHVCPLCAQKTRCKIFHTPTNQSSEYFATWCQFCFSLRTWDLQRLWYPCLGTLMRSINLQIPNRNLMQQERNCTGHLRSWHWVSLSTASVVDLFATTRLDFVTNISVSAPVLVHCCIHVGMKVVRCTKQTISFPDLDNNGCQGFHIAMLSAPFLSAIQGMQDVVSWTIRRELRLQTGNRYVPWHMVTLGPGAEYRYHISTILYIRNIICSKLPVTPSPASLGKSTSTHISAMQRFKQWNKNISRNYATAWTVSVKCITRLDQQKLESKL